MKKNYNFSFAVSYVAGLEKNLLKKNELKNLKLKKTKQEVLSYISNFGYKIKNFENQEEIENTLNEKLILTLNEIKKICPKTQDFNNVLFKNDFLNFKLCLNSILFKKEENFSNVVPFSVNPKKIALALKKESFEEINSPFKEIFFKIFEFAKEVKDFKKTEILTDKNMYSLLLKNAENNSFFKKRLKLEIDLKNLNFAVRFLKYSDNFKFLEFCLMEEGTILKKEIIDSLKNKFNGPFNLLKKLSYFPINLTLKEDLNHNLKMFEKTSEKILQQFDENQNFSYFSFIPIFLYINKLKKEIKSLKEIILKINFNNL